jgi:hypothetical protein
MHGSTHGTIIYYLDRGLSQKLGTVLLPYYHNSWNENCRFLVPIGRGILSHRTYSFAVVKKKFILIILLLFFVLERFYQRSAAAPFRQFGSSRHVQLIALVELHLAHVYVASTINGLPFRPVQSLFVRRKWPLVLVTTLATTTD